MMNLIDPIIKKLGSLFPFTICAFVRLISPPSELLKKSNAFAGDIPWFKPSAARGAWKLGRTLQAEGGTENEKKSKVELSRAMRLRRELDPKDDRKEPELTDADWDSLVFYYYR